LTVVCLLIICLLAAATLTGWNDLDAQLDRSAVDWEAEFERAQRESLRDHMTFYVDGGAQLRAVPLDWTSRDRCPACFGTDMCDAVDRQVGLDLLFHQTLRCVPPTNSTRTCLSVCPVCALTCESIDLETSFLCAENI